MVKLFGCARRLNQAFQFVEGRRGCVSACCSKYQHKELFLDCSAEFEMKGSEVQYNILFAPFEAVICS